VKPLPIWFFGFEGLMGAAYDVCHVWHGAWMALVALGAGVTRVVRTFDRRQQSSV